MDDDLSEILTTLQERFQTERTFFATYRFMNADTRDHLAAAHLRNTQNTLALLRYYMMLHVNRPPAEPDVVVSMSVPVQFNNNNAFWDPVNVRPSTEQIRAGTEREIPVTGETCAVCQDSVTVATRIRHCGHCFHANCIDEWFTLNARCPVCRHDIRDTSAPAPAPAPAPPAGEDRPDWEWYINDGRRDTE